MCRGDSDEGPLLESVWNGEKDVRVLLPPAPPLVLAKSGPQVFAAEFGLSVKQVFPMRFHVVPRFATPPEGRAVTLDVSGRIP